MSTIDHISCKALAVLRPLSQLLLLLMAIALWCYTHHIGQMISISTAVKYEQFHLVWHSLMFVALFILLPFATRTDIALAFNSAISGVLAQSSLCLAVMYSSNGTGGQLPSSQMMTVVVGAMLFLALMTQSVLMVMAQPYLNIGQTNQEKPKYPTEDIETQPIE